LDEISLISEIEEKELRPVLDEFVSNNQLIFKDGIYFYNKPVVFSKRTSKLPPMFQFYSPETIDMIVKCFCADISVCKTTLILAPNLDCLCNFNKFFRKLIYEKQETELLEYFKNNPQTGRSRIFFNIPMYFYFYNDKLYISKKLLEAPNSTIFTKKQITEFKKTYSYLARVTSHNSNKINLPHHLAEMIWRRNKSYNEQFKELINFLAS